MTNAPSQFRTVGELVGSSKFVKQNTLVADYFGELVGAGKFVNQHTLVADE